MSASKSSISDAGSYQEMGKFWDQHDLTEVWDCTESVEFSVNISSQRKYFALDINMSNRVSEIARMHGISSETLVNLWVQGKLSQKI